MSAHALQIGCERFVTDGIPGPDPLAGRCSCLGCVDVCAPTGADERTPRASWPGGCVVLIIYPSQDEERAAGACDREGWHRDEIVPYHWNDLDVALEDGCCHSQLQISTPSVLSDTLDKFGVLRIRVKGETMSSYV